MTTPLPDDELTELIDFLPDRVDLVGKAANGTRFLIAKQDQASAGLLDPEFVRDLIAKAEPDPEPAAPEQVTMTGSPAAIAAFIHKASVRPAPPRGVAKAGKSGIEVPKEAEAVAAVSKDTGPELDEGVDGMDPTVPLAAPEGDVPGDPTDPGSPAWEAIDAATAQKWTSIAVCLKNALCIMAEREMLEAASADPGDAGNAFDLEDAQCALDYVIDTLAGFAVDEQAEADLGGEAMEAIGKSALPDGALAAIRKAMGSGDLSGPLTVIETFGTIVAKSGRVLSSVNEAHIREAHARLNTVLSSLPQAPTTDDGQQVAKMTPTEEAGMPEPALSEDVTAASGQEPAMGTAGPEPVAKAEDGHAAPAAEPVRKSALALVYDRDGNLAGVTDSAAIVQRVAKADGDGEKKAMQAVFDQDGDLIGIVDPDAIQPVTGAGGKAPADDGADAAPAADDGDMTPQPPADAGTPAGAADDDGIAKSSDNEVYAALESIVAKAVAAALGAQAPAEDVAKSADVAGLSEQVETLKARLAVVEETPAAPKVFTNGQTPRPGQMRGQDRGASAQVDVAKARERRHAFLNADPADQNRIADEMQQGAIDALAAIHGR